MVRASLKPSPLLAIALAAVHLSAGAILVPLDLPVALKGAVALIIGVSLCRSVWRYALLRGRHSIVAVEVCDQENGAVSRRDGLWEEVTILGTTYVTPTLTVINARPVGARFASHLLLTPDNLAPDDFRQIRVLLRWARPKRLATEAAGSSEVSTERVG